MGSRLTNEFYFNATLVLESIVRGYSHNTFGNYMEGNRITELGKKEKSLQESQNKKPGVIQVEGCR
jgi:hypothetical protein